MVKKEIYLVSMNVLTNIELLFDIHLQNIQCCNSQHCHITHPYNVLFEIKNLHDSIQVQSGNMILYLIKILKMTAVRMKVKKVVMSMLKICSDKQHEFKCCTLGIR